MISCICIFLQMKMWNVHFSFTCFRIWTAAYQNVPKSSRERESVSLVFNIWTSLLMINDIWQSLCLAYLYAKFYQIFQNVSRDRASFTVLFFSFFRIWTSTKPRTIQMTFDNLLSYIFSISTCMQNFITIFHSVRLFSLFQNLELGTASTDVKCHFAISWARFGNPSVKIMPIVMCMQNYIKIYQKVQEIGSVSLFQNLNLGKTSTNPKSIRTPRPHYHLVP